MSKFIHRTTVFCQFKSSGAKSQILHYGRGRGQRVCDQPLSRAPGTQPAHQQEPPEVSRQPLSRAPGTQPTHKQEPPEVSRQPLYRAQGTQSAHQQEPPEVTAGRKC